MWSRGKPGTEYGVQCIYTLIYLNSNECVLFFAGILKEHWISMLKVTTL